MAKSTQPRCKAGFTRSKKTGNCEPKGSSNKTRAASPKAAAAPSKKAATQRCPRGCVKDRKTKQCMSKSGGPCGAASRKSSSHRKSSSSHRKSSSSHRKPMTPVRAKTPTPARAKTPSSPKQHHENAQAMRYAHQISNQIRSDLRHYVTFGQVPKNVLRPGLKNVVTALAQVTATGNYRDFKVHIPGEDVDKVQAISKFGAISDIMTGVGSFLNADDIQRLAKSEHIPADANATYAMVVIAMRAASEYIE